MGKSSLMLRILDRAAQQGYRSTWLNLQAAEEKSLENLDSLLKWLCSRISRKLGLKDKVEEYWQVRSDFFGLLRSWHEESKFNPVWRNLRLILAHSKEVYVPLNINQSPFNVGLPLEKPITSGNKHHGY